MKLKFDWTDLHDFFTRYSFVNSPLCSLDNTLPPLLKFGGVKFQFSDFAISSYLTSKLNTNVQCLVPAV